MTEQEPTPDLQQLLSQLSEVTVSLQAAQAQAAARVVEGSAGGGAVRVTMTAAMVVHGVHIDPSVIDPAESELLSDLVLAALRDAIDHAQQAQAEAMGGAGGLLGP